MKFLEITPSLTLRYLIHAVPSYNERLYKERLVDHRNFKEWKLVNLEKLKNVFQNPTIQTF